MPKPPAKNHRGSSSPLARGPLSVSADAGGNFGLIPARAGTTSGRRQKALPEWAHPRSRGDHRDYQGNYHIDWGSSPLARGPRGTRRPRFLGSGLIPARAGTTLLPRRLLGTGRAHPRSRGDHLFLPLFSFGFGGSSPLARGPRRVPRRLPRIRRLIPARAGNMRTGARYPGAGAAHPRSRGEHVPGRVLPGSRSRLIPARAGNMPRHPHR